MTCMNLKYVFVKPPIPISSCSYSCKVPPFNDQDNIQTISSDIAVLLKDWVEDARRPQSSFSGGDLPIDLLDRTIAKYMEELAPDRRETKSIFEDVKRQLRRYW